MLSFPPTVRVFLCQVPVDMRRSFNGLAGSVEEHFQADPLNGHLYVFFNRRSTIVKVLVWDRTGFVIYSKRLEQGRFQYHQYASKEPLDFARLLLILEGIDLRDSGQRRRFYLTKKKHKRVYNSGVN